MTRRRNPRLLWTIRTCRRLQANPIRPRRSASLPLPRAEAQLPRAKKAQLPRAEALLMAVPLQASRRHPRAKLAQRRRMPKMPRKKAVPQARPAQLPNSPTPRTISRTVSTFRCRATAQCRQPPPAQRTRSVRSLVVAAFSGTARAIPTCVARALPTVRPQAAFAQAPATAPETPLWRAPRIGSAPNPVGRACSEDIAAASLPGRACRTQIAATAEGRAGRKTRCGGRKTRTSRRIPSSARMQPGAGCSFTRSCSCCCSRSFTSRMIWSRKCQSTASFWVRLRGSSNSWRRAAWSWGMLLRGQVTRGTRRLRTSPSSWILTQRSWPVT